MLLLVDLTLLDEGVDLAETVDTEADVLQHARVVPRDQLGPDDPGVRSIQLLDQQANRPRIQSHVIVQEAEEPVLALHQSQDLVGGGAVACGLSDGAYEGIGHSLAHPIGHVTCFADHQEQALQIGVILVGETVEHLVEPVSGIGHHHHGHDGRGELAGGFHEAARLLRRAVGVGPHRPGDPHGMPNSRWENC